MQPRIDRVVIYDEINTDAISANSYVDLPSLNAGEKLLCIEEIWVWPPYEAGAPADLKDVQILIDGSPYPPDGHFHVRAKAERNMAVPYDPRYPVDPIPIGVCNPDPLLDTCIKVPVSYTHLTLPTICSV